MKTSYSYIPLIRRRWFSDLRRRILIQSNLKSMNFQTTFAYSGCTWIAPLLIAKDTGTGGSVDYGPDEFYFFGYLNFELPKLVPTERATSTSCPFGSTLFKCFTASAIFTPFTSEPCKATICPNFFSATNATALTP